jgi:hypothetical protein
MGMLTLIPPAAERRIRREARSETLRECALALRRGGWTFAAIGKALGVSLERARQVVRKAERRKRDPHWYDGLPVRAIYFLHGRSLTSVPEIEAAHAVARLSRRELMNTPNFGAGACAAVIAWLARHGLKLQPESSHAFSVRLRRCQSEVGAYDRKNEPPRGERGGPRVIT